MNFQRLLVGKNLSLERFEKAFAESVAMYKDMPVENSERLRLVAALAYEPGKHLVDVGSHVNIYPVVLAKLGMQVTVVDTFPEATLPGLEEQAHKIQHALDVVYPQAGITVAKVDAYDMQLPKASADICSAFETFEHLWQSPKPVFQKMVETTKPGGKVIIALPNIARLASRVKALIGRSILPAFPDYYEHGYPFYGHRREMTVGEVRWMFKREGLTIDQLFTTDIVVPTMAYSSALSALCHKGLNRVPLPMTLREGIYAVGRKS